MRNIKINLKRDADKIELLKAVGSRTKTESMPAQEALAAFVGPIVSQVLDQLATSSLIYRTVQYDRDTMPSIPLDLFEGNDEGLIDIWSQSIAGGLPTNHISGMNDYRFTTYRLDTAVSFLKRYARDARLDVISLALRKVAQELLIKQEYNAFGVILKALAESSSYNSGKAHLLDSTTADVFQVDDLNRMWTMAKRLRSSWVGGTPIGSPGRGITDMLVSPEIMEQIRSFAYQPMNTRGVPDSAESTALGLPDAIRTRIFQSAGAPEIFGINFIELLELGVGKPYTVLFDKFYTAGGGEPSFSSSTDELAIGLDLSLDFAIRVVENDPDTGSTITTEVDDQFVARSEKLGWYTHLTEGRIVTDNKAITGLVV